MIPRESVGLSVEHTKPVVPVSCNDDDWSLDSDSDPDVESDGDDYGDFDNGPPDELDFEIEDEPDPEPGDFWLDDDEEED